MPFVFDEYHYGAKLCKFDYAHGMAWCATKVENDEIVDWKYCDETALNDFNREGKSQHVFEGIYAE